VRNAIQKLKYKRDISLGIVLAHPIIDLFATLNWKIDCVVPVPLGVARLRERGYNQSALLARPLAMSSGIKYRPQALQRVHETSTQVGLTIQQRRENVKDAFRSFNREVEGKSVLIVDDVMTSGATLESCTTALIKAGAVKVFALTLARALKK
jgi:ComF family protein